MQIVIKIPDLDYFDIKHGYADNYQRERLVESVKCSIELPKNHGRLITEPTDEEIAKTIGGKNDFAECIREAVKVVFDNATTIIPADKDGEE